MHALYLVPHEVKNQRALAKRTSQIMINGEDVNIQMRCGTDRVNIPCPMHENRPSQLDVKMTNV